MTEVRKATMQVIDRPLRLELNGPIDLNVHAAQTTAVLRNTMGTVVEKAKETRSRMGLVLPGPRPSVEAMRYPEIAGVEFHRVNPYVVAVDMGPILEKHHPYWQGELLEVARQQPDAVITPGFDETSMVEPGKESTFYKPTRQSVIKESLQWAHSLFEHEIRFLVERLTKDRTMRLGVDQSALNMNFTEEEPYELHVDRNKITALLGVSNVKENVGGLLRVHEKRDEHNRPAGRHFDIRPQAGMLYFFLGNKHPHEVLPYFGVLPRVVMPGDYYSESNPEIIDTKFNNEIGLGTQILARERLSDSGQLIVVDFTNGRGVNGRSQNGQQRESIRITPARKSPVAA